MKVSRDDLKNIVKECLVEILSEGLESTSRTINESRRSPQVQQSARTQMPPARTGVADKIAFLPKATQQNANNQRSFDRKSLTQMTSDPILQEMLADTATRGTPILDESKNSPVVQEAAVALHGDTAAKAMLKSDPTDIFGETSSKWAMLAFTDKKIGA